MLEKRKVGLRVSQHFIPGDNVFQQLPQSRYCSSMLLGKTTRWVTIHIVALLCTMVTHTLCMNIYCSILCSSLLE